MSAPTETSAGTAAIRPFTVPVTTDAELEALRARRGHPPARPVDDVLRERGRWGLPRDELCRQLFNRSSPISS